MVSIEPSVSSRDSTPAEADPAFVETILQRDRLIVAGGLGIVIVASWLWILLGAGVSMDAMMTAGMTAGMPPSHMAGAPDRGMDAMPMGLMMPAVWTTGYAALIFSMWWIMMVAMMLPSTTPTLLLFARINRKERIRGRPYVPTAAFAAGYLATWGGFSAIAAGLQWGLERYGLLPARCRRAHPVYGWARGC